MAQFHTQVLGISGTSDKGPSEIGMTTLHLFRSHANNYFTSEIGTTSLQGTKVLPKVSLVQRFHCNNQ